MAGAISVRGRRRIGPLEWAHQQRRALTRLMNDLVGLGYSAELSDDKLHRTGWIVRVEHPMRDRLPMDLRQKTRLMVWCRPTIEGEWRYEWPYDWPFATVDQFGAGLAYVTTLLGPASTEK